MSEENLKEQLDAIEKHLKWCVDNNKPQEQIDLHKEILDEIKQELKYLNQKKMSKFIKGGSEWYGDKYNWIISITRSKNSKLNKLKVKRIKPKEDELD